MLGGQAEAASAANAWLEHFDFVEILFCLNWFQETLPYLVILVCE